MHDDVDEGEKPSTYESITFESFSGGIASRDPLSSYCIIWFDLKD